MRLAGYEQWHSLGTRPARARELFLSARGLKQGSQVTARRLQTPAPFFSLARAAWVPCVVTRHPVTGEFRRVEGSRGFASYREALQASRVLAARGSVSSLTDRTRLARATVALPHSDISQLGPRCLE